MDVIEGKHKENGKQYTQKGDKQKKMITRGA